LGGGRQDKFVRIATDVKRSIQEGYDQACDVVRYIQSATGNVAFFNSNSQDRKQAAEISAADIENVIPIVFLDSYYGMVATDLQPWLSADSGIGFPWLLIATTLESILLKIATFEQLQSFLLWRRGLHGLVANEDEAVFAGFFLRHGPIELPKEADMIQLSHELCGHL